MKSPPHRELTGAVWIIAALLAASCLALEAPSGTPQATPSTPAPSLADEWSTLRRPLTLPAAGSDPLCRASAGRKIQSGVADALGDGPVYPVGLGTAGHLRLADALTRDGVFYWKVLWISGPNYDRRVLIRGARLDGSGGVVFGSGDTFGWAELRLPVEAWATGADLDAGWRMWPSYTGTRSAGCFGYQVDGADFTVRLTFEVGR
jgi:hypothetical protein